MTLLGYAIAEVFRGRRRTVSSLIGLILAIAFISGTFIAIDSSLRTLVEESLVGVQADVILTTSTDRPIELARDLRAVSGVRAVAPFAGVSVEEVGRWGEAPIQTLEFVGLDPENLPSELRSVQIEGTMAMAAGTTAVSNFVAREAGVRLGDVLYVKGSFFDPANGSREVRYVNLTVQGIVTYPDDWRPPRFSVNALSQHLAAVHLRDAMDLSDQLVGRRALAVVNEISIDRNALLDPYDAPTSQENLARLAENLRRVATPYGSVTIYNFVSEIVGDLERALPLYRGIYIALSLPLILLGVSLAAVGIDLGHAERRRELAILKTRGARPRQIATVLLLESLVIGVLAAGIGLIAGVAIGRIVAPSTTFFISTNRGLEAVVLDPNSILTTIVLSVVFAFVASVRSARRAARSPIVEGLRHYSPGEAKLEYRRTLDLCLVALGLATFAFDFAYGFFGGSLFGLLAGPLLFILLPLAPFVLLVSFTRLATRWTPRVYEVTAKILKPVAKNLEHLISRNLGRNPRRASNIAILIALGVAFGVFILSLNQSFVMREDRILRASIGADIGGLPRLGDTSFAGNLTSVPGVASVSLIFDLPARPLFGPDSSVPNVFALDPDPYFTTSRPEPWFFVDGRADAARGVLANAGQVLVSEAFAASAAIVVGDVLPIGYEGPGPTGEPESRQLDVTVGGIVRGLPGLSASSDFLPLAVYGSTVTLEPILSADPSAPAGTGGRFLVDLAADADWRPAKETILGLGATDVRVYDQEREAMNRNPAARNILDFFAVEIGFVLLVLTAGLALMTYAASLDREAEFAGIIARGASPWQTAGLLLGEAFAILVIGTLVGVGAGMAATYGAGQVLGPGPGGAAYEPLIPFPFVVPVEAVLVVALAFLVMLSACLLVAWRIARMDVARVLKQRAG